MLPTLLRCFRKAASPTRRSLPSRRSAVRTQRVRPTIEVLEERTLLATHFVLSGIPASLTAGTQATLSVTAANADGSTDTAYAGTVHLSSSDSKAFLSPDSTLSGGTGSFMVQLRTVGSQSVTANDTLTPAISGTVTGIAITPAATARLVVSGFGSSVTSGVAGNLTVTAVDAFGNLTPSYTGTVGFSSSDSYAALPVSSTLTSGTGTFSATLETAGSQSITATDTLTSSITGTQGSISVRVAQFLVSSFPTTTAGTTASCTVTAADISGNPITGYNGTVHFTSSDPQATLPADAPLSNGLGTFTVQLRTVGSQSITATDTSNPGLTGTDPSIAVVPAATARLVVSGFGSSVTSGVAGNLTVTAVDAFGNLTPGYTGTVGFSSSDSYAALPTSSTLTGGTGTFSATLETAGSQSITATDTLTSSITGTQGPINVLVAQFLVNGFPATTAGTAGSFTVTAADFFGNPITGYSGTVHFTSSDPQATLPADAPLTNGLGTFSATLKTAGSQSITASDSIISGITGSQASIAMAAAPLAQLVLRGLGSPVTAGVTGTVTVMAADAYGNLISSYGGTVHLTSTDPRAVLSPDAALTNGVGTFNVKFKTAGPQSITATDTASPSLTGTDSAEPQSATFDFDTSTPALYTGENTPFSQTANGITATFNSPVGQGAYSIQSDATSGYTLSQFSGNYLWPNTANKNALDIYFAQPISSITLTFATVEFQQTATPSTIQLAAYQDSTTSAPIGVATAQGTYASDTLPMGTLTFSSGRGSFNLVEISLPAQFLGATSFLVDNITVTTANPSALVVNPGATTQFLVQGLPSPATAGAAGTFSVTAADKYGNPTPNYSGTVHFTSSDGQATLPVDAALTNGVGTFSATLVTAGSQTLSVADTNNPSLHGTSPAITVNPGLADHFVVLAPGSVTVGTAFTFSVVAQDQFNNPATGYNGSVRFGSTDSFATLPGLSHLTAGVGTFSASLQALGSQTLTATDAVNSTITGRSNVLSSHVGAPDHFTVSAPSNAVSGGTFQFTVTVQDLLGYTVTGYTGSVSFQTSDPAVGLLGNASLTNGVGTFTATLRTAGTQTLKASDTGLGINGSSGPIVVSAGPATHYTIKVVPGGITSGSTVSLTVTALDAFNNVARGYNGFVQFSSTDSQATLPPISTLTNGTGTFSAILRTAGNVQVAATDLSKSSITGSDTVTVVGTSPPPPVGSFLGHSVQSVSTAFDSSGQAITAIVYSGDLLYVFDASGAHFIGSFVQSASIAFNPSGQEIIDVVFANHLLYSYDVNGAHFIGSGVQSVSIAFDAQGQQLTAVVFDAGGLYIFSGSGSRFVAPNVRSVSIAVDNQGQQVLDLVYSDGTLYQFDASGAHLIGNSIADANVTFDHSGQRVLDVVFASGDWWQY